MITTTYIVLQARHTQRLEVAQRASRPQQELGWDDADADHQPQPQQPSAATSLVHQPKQLSQAEAPSTACSPTQGSTAAADDAAEGKGREASAATPSMQAVPEEHEVTVGSGSRQAEGPSERQEGMDSGAETHTEEAHNTAVTTGDEDASETITSSDSGSGHEHWTVVKSPSKQCSGEKPSVLTGMAPSTGSPEGAAADPSTADQSKPAVSQPASVSSKSAVLPADDSSEIDELDDVSNDGDLDAGNGPGSEAEEDWGSWE